MYRYFLESAAKNPNSVIFCRNGRCFNPDAGPGASLAHPVGRVGDNAGVMSEPLPPPTAPQPRNPLHGMTLEAIVTALAAHYGWAELGVRIPVRCFTQDPSVASSLKFLRKTPWAREKVEGLYLFMLREIRRQGHA